MAIKADTSASRSNVVDTTKAVKGDEGERTRKPAYLAADGSFVHEPSADSVGVVIYLGDTGEKQIIRFDELPSHMIQIFAAFGAQTALNNAWNSGKASGNSKERYDNRLEAFKSGHWSNRGTGEGKEQAPRVKATPLIVKAIAEFARKTNKASKNFPTWEEFEAVRGAEYHAMNRKERSAFDTVWLKKDKGIEKIYLQLKAAEDKAKTAKVTQKEIEASADDEF